MQLLQVAIEGVPGTKAPLEYRFEPGLNPWKQKGTFPLETIIDILVSLFYPVSSEKELLGPGKSRRAWVTFEVREQTYKLIRDYSQKKSTLAQLEPGSQEKFRDLSSEPRFISETLNRSAKLPTQKIFRNFLISHPGRTEWFDPVSSIGGREPVENSIFSNPNLNPSETLESLIRERNNLSMIKEAETKLDELQAAVFRIDEELRRLVAPREEVKRLLAEYERYRVFDQEGLITAQLIAKLKAYPSVCDKRDADLKAAEENAALWNLDLVKMGDRPIWMEPAAIGGAVATLIGFIGASVHREWLGFYLPVSLIGVAVTGLGVFLGHKRIEKLTALKKKVRNADPEKSGIEKRFEIETTAIRNLCAAVREKDTQEILVLIQRWKELQVEVQAAKKALQEVEEKVPGEKLKKESQDFTAQIKALEAQLSEIPPITMDPQMLDQQIAELEAVLKSKGISPAPKKANTQPEQDAVVDLFSYTSELLGRSMGEVVSKIQKAVDANVAAVTQKKYLGMKLNQGSFTGFCQANGEEVHWVGLSPEEKALLYFSVQFTLWQFAVSVRPLTFFMDLLSYSVSETVANVSLAAARHVAKKTQVIVLSP